MKKFFAFVAVALVAFGFASCNGNDPVVNGFKITVSDIQATSAIVKVEPVDTAATNVAYYFAAADIKGMSDDSLKLSIKANMDYYIDMYGAYGVELTYADFLMKGTLTDTMSLTPKTDYVFTAIKMDDKGEFIGDFAKKTFSTPDVVISKTVDLGVLPEGGFEDYRDYDGSFLAYGTNGKLADVTLNIYSETIAGKFTEADLELEYSYVWTPEAGQYGLPIVKAEIEGKENAAAKTASMAGYVVGSDQVKYTFSFEFSTAAEEMQEGVAPKKAAAKKAPARKPAFVAKGLKKF